MTNIQPGQHYGKWTVIKQRPYRNLQQMWLCKCACGTQRVLPYNNLYFSKSTQCKQCGYKNRKQVSPRIFVDINGKSMSIREASIILGKPMNTIRTRLRLGIPLMSPTIKGRHANLLSHLGKAQTMAGWAKQFGISRERVRQRIARGETISEIAKTYGF